MQFDGHSTLEHETPASPSLHISAYDAEEYLEFFTYENENQGDGEHDEDALAALADFYERSGEFRVYLFKAAMREFVQPKHWLGHTGVIIFDDGEILDYLDTVVADAERMAAAGFADIVAEHPPLFDLTLRRMASAIASRLETSLDDGDMHAYLSRLQSVRGHFSGEARRKGTALAKDHEPWKAAGVSRRTWYRRQKDRNPGTHGGARRGAGRPAK